ncbi:TraR/DksA C4-type zinc finger protein [Sutcliffiella deserti]|uniref:TraR/DksA C4-type zinc finger protein n=1 Tax=Sutcliffiella deserti TaxID=2875501 RepID=UPI001CBFCCA7|nr:TraR/DksA C4-type zinc finger protein [Sutcliffiella deserti]
MSLSKEKTQKLERKLLDMKQSIEQKKKNSKFDESMRESTGELTTGIGNHIAEGNAERVEREQEQTFDQIDEKLLGEIDEALERIDNGTYGTCVDTGEEIPYERLEALPYAKRTAQAQQEVDRTM